MSSTFIDDQDYTRVKYHGSWIQGGSPSEHKGTVASSTVEGDYFTVSFYGSTITVFGTIDATSGGVLTNYSVDGAPPDQVISQAGGGDTYDQQFWGSGWLHVGNHELKVTMIKVNPDPMPNEGTVWFDYFKATDPTIRPPSGSSSQKHRIGEIVGGTLGGLLFLATLLTGLVVMRRRRRRKQWLQKATQGIIEQFPLKSEKHPSGIQSDHGWSGESTGGVGSIRPFLDQLPIVDINPNNADSHSGLSPLSPITPITPTSSGVILPQKLLREMSSSDAQASSSSSIAVEPPGGLRGMKQTHSDSFSAISSTLDSTSGSRNVTATTLRNNTDRPRVLVGSSSTSFLQQRNDDTLSFTPITRLSPILFGVSETSQEPVSLTPKQEAIISGAIDMHTRTTSEQGIDGGRDTSRRQTFDTRELEQDDDVPRQAPIIRHIDSGVRHALTLDLEGNPRAVGDSDASSRPVVTIPIELPPVYSPV